MKKIRFLMMVLPLLLIAGMAYAQKKEITGRVVDQATGLPLAGVSVTAGKDKKGSMTKEDGTFSISVGSGIKSLSFSSVSYTAQTVSIEKASVLNVLMTAEASLQSEVVVIGYGTQKRSNISGAVSKYKN